MASQIEIQQQQALLDAHRHTLSVYLRQRALQGQAFTPPSTENGINEARNNIRNIKKILRGWGALVEDRPDDEEQSFPDAIEGTGGKGGVGFLGIIGLLTFFVGFALFGYVVLSFIMQIFNALASRSSTPPDLSHIPFQLIPIGFGLAFVGIVIGSIGGINMLRRGRRSRRLILHSHRYRL
jgi:hypothetical protein